MWFSTAEKVCSSSYDERCWAASALTGRVPSAARRSGTARAVERMVDSSVKRGEALARVGDELGVASGRQRNRARQGLPGGVAPLERDLGQAQNVRETRVAGIDRATLGERRLRFA